MNLRSALIFALAALTSSVFAQAESFDSYACNIALLQDKGVQAEIGVTEAQRKNLNVQADWFNAEAAKIKKQGESVKTEAAGKALSQKLQALLVEMKAKCLKVLTPGQVKRLRELSLQLQAPAVLLDDRVAKQVGISADQLKKMRASYKANIDKASKLQESTFRPIAQKYEKQAKGKKEAELKKIREAMDKEMKAASARIQPQVMRLGGETRTALLKSLSAAQNSAYQKLLGKSYTFR